ncbi:hypothetical protein V6N12_049047 [Hibiscus sabdariffa]|uniref:Uncharacterized protein n=1 Tax=Hibiscus sabdariffa TaxID=183260 RepID=A0ABR2ELD7_9ROSI
MATNSSSSIEGLPTRFSSTTIRERYHNIVAAKNIWEEQGFFFDDSLENYRLEPIIYKRLNDLGWLRFGRQPARANLNWVKEFYAHNVDGDDTVIVRGSAMRTRHQMEYKRQEPKNHQPPTSLARGKAMEYEKSLQGNYQRPTRKTKVFLPSPTSSMPSADELLYLPTLQTSTHWRGRTICTKGAQPSPASTPQANPSTNLVHTPAATLETPNSRQPTPDSPMEAAAPSSPTQPEETTPLHILQLRNQLQRIEAWQLQFMEDTKVFQTSLTNFLCFQFLKVAAFFAVQPTTTHPSNFSAATQPKSTAKPSDGAGNTEKVNLSSNDENEIFDWHTLMEHHG